MLMCATVTSVRIHGCVAVAFLMLFYQLACDVWCVPSTTATTKNVRMSRNALCTRPLWYIYINIRRYNVIANDRLEWVYSATKTAVQIVLCTLNVFILHNAVLVVFFWLWYHIMWWYAPNSDAPRNVRAGVSPPPAPRIVMVLIRCQ